MCSECGETLCSWEELKEDVVNFAKERIKELETTDNRNGYHNAAYRVYVLKLYRYLGPSTRLCLPNRIIFARAGRIRRKSIRNFRNPPMTLLFRLHVVRDGYSLRKIWAQSRSAVILGCM